MTICWFAAFTSILKAEVTLPALSWEHFEVMDSLEDSANLLPAAFYYYIKPKLLSAMEIILKCDYPLQLTVKFKREDSIRFMDKSTCMHTHIYTIINIHFIYYYYY